MNLRLLSDLHLEGNRFEYRYSGEDILVLAGDIHTKNRHHEFINQVPEHVEIIMVAGNHEAYHMVYQEVKHYLKGLEELRPGFHFLDNEAITIGDIEFFGGTMFTDMELYGIHEQWFAEHEAKKCIADFHHIAKWEDDPYKLTNELRQWNLEDHKAEHKVFVRELKHWLGNTEGKKRVVVTHFVPTEQVTPARFKHSMLNPYFMCNMETYMGWDGLWLFGHTHDSTTDLRIGETRLFCNPHGYGRENEGNYHKTRHANDPLYGFIPNLIIEI